MPNYVGYLCRLWICVRCCDLLARRDARDINSANNIALTRQHARYLMYLRAANLILFVW